MKKYVSKKDLLDAVGVAGTVGGPGESALRILIDGGYKGRYQLDEGMGVLPAALLAWNSAKWIDEKSRGVERSPLVNLGRAMEIAGPAATEYKLLANGPGDVIYDFIPAIAGVVVGPILEYGLGPLHEKFSSKEYNVPKDRMSAITPII
ncbi:MAG: hypothetical protein NT120_02865 [Candidatus Aenigmarchaeota archaeon]|nr:hypothetical protein [Candidatus Aenigmarchaeota archaeon]